MTLLSRFTIGQPNESSGAHNEDIILTIEHLSSTTVENVGYQVWKGCFLMIDYLIYQHKAIVDTVVIELGAGCGVCGVALSLLSHKCSFITDYTVELTHLINDNIQRNAHLMNKNTWNNSNCSNDIRVRKLDWMDLDSQYPITPVSPRVDSVRYYWTEDDICMLQHPNRLFIAADVIYDDMLTEAFFLKLSQLIRLEEKLILTIEKRFNYSLASQSVCATGYNLFLAIVNSIDNQQYKQNEQVQFSKFIKHFTGKKLDTTSIPQYMKCYERNSDLEIWEITCKS